MSDGYDYFAAPPSSTFGGPTPTLTSSGTAGPSSPPPARTRPPTRLLWAGGIIAVLALVVAGWWLRPVHDHRPVALPEAVLGLPRAEGVRDFGTQPSWRTVAEGDLPDVTMEGRAYRRLERSQPLQINIVVARTDLTGKLDRRLGVKPYLAYGSVTCTHTFDLSTKASPASPATTDRMLLCWRTSSGLSVSALVLRQGAVTDAQIADAVQQVWALQPA